MREKERARPVNREAFDENERRPWRATIGLSSLGNCFLSHGFCPFPLFPIYLSVHRLVWLRVQKVRPQCRCSWNRPWTAVVSSSMASRDAMCIFLEDARGKRFTLLSRKLRFYLSATCEKSASDPCKRRRRWFTHRAATAFSLVCAALCKWELPGMSPRDRALFVCVRTHVCVYEGTHERMCVWCVWNLCACVAHYISFDIHV